MAVDISLSGLESAGRTATALADADLLLITQDASGLSKVITVANASAAESKKGVAELATAAEILLGTDATRIVTPAQLQAAMPPGYISGLITANDTDTDHDINITAGGCRDDGDAINMVLASEITKQIDATWALGDDAGGLDTGSVANTTLYAVWLIRRSDTGVVDALFSASFTAPAMPANYDQKRLIGAVYTDGSANILQYTQTGDYFRYTTPYDTGRNYAAPQTASGADLAVTLSAVPVKCRADVCVSFKSYTSADVFLGVMVKEYGTADAIGATGKHADMYNSDPNAPAASFSYVSVKSPVYTDASQRIEISAVTNTGSAWLYNAVVLGYDLVTRRNP